MTGLIVALPFAISSGLFQSRAVAGMVVCPILPPESSPDQQPGRLPMLEMPLAVLSSPARPRSDEDRHHVRPRLRSLAGVAIAGVAIMTLFASAYIDGFDPSGPLRYAESPFWTVLALSVGCVATVVILIASENQGGQKKESNLEGLPLPRRRDGRRLPCLRQH